VDLFCHFLVSGDTALVLAQVLGPGIDQKRLQVVAGIFQVAKNSPAVGPVATTDAFVFVNCGEERRFLPG